MLSVIKITQIAPWHQSSYQSFPCGQSQLWVQSDRPHIKYISSRPPGKLWMKNTRRPGKAQPHQVYMFLDRYEIHWDTLCWWFAVLSVFISAKLNFRWIETGVREHVMENHNINSGGLHLNHREEVFSVEQLIASQISIAKLFFSVKNGWSFVCITILSVDRLQHRNISLLTALWLLRQPYLFREEYAVCA